MARKTTSSFRGKDSEEVILPLEEVILPLEEEEECARGKVEEEWTFPSSSRGSADFLSSFEERKRKRRAAPLCHLIRFRLQDLIEYR